jgi:site-specific DNA-methyltransferase (adenine-specific)
MKRFINKVFHSDCLTLLRAMPDNCVHAVLTDAMYGVKCRYDWGGDPASGDFARHWDYHQPIYRECLRVLRPNGVLAWGQSFKAIHHFNEWFGNHRVWSPVYAPLKGSSLTFLPNIWVVQTRERQAQDHPNNMLIHVAKRDYLTLRQLHPCPKPVEEMIFMIESLTRPGDLILDCFCGLGSTLVAAQRLNRCWIGCDRSRRYCQITMHRLALDRNRLFLGSSPT